MKDIRHWERLGVGILGAILLVAAIGTRTERAVASSDDHIAYTGTIQSEFRLLRQSLDTTSGQLELVRLKLERAEAVLAYSTRYQVPADLVELIYDTALKQALDPDLAFRLVNVESGFVAQARSRAGALGLAQVQPGTARFYEPGVTQEQLLDPATNLRIGFRYLRDLLTVYGDIELALLAYNRGPARLKELMDGGRDPRNGYAASVMEGYTALR